MSLAGRANLFELLDDDAADVNLDAMVARNIKANAEAAKSEVKAAAAAAAAAAPVATEAKSKPASDQNKGKRDDRKPRENRPPRDNNAERKPRRRTEQSGEEAPAANGDVAQAGKDRRRPEGGRAPRDRKPADGENPPARRQFDRRGAPGRNPYDDKKGGAGRHNWGKEGEVAEEAAQETTETPVAEAETTEAKEVAAPVEEVKELTLEDYKKAREQQLAELSALAPKKELRKAGEGVDSSAWADTVPLARKNAVEEEEADEESSKKEKKVKQVVPLSEFIQVDDSSRDSRRGARGGRGGIRPKSARSNFKAPDVSDEKSFPSLASVVRK